jgi:hypothetical protein
MLLVVKLLLEGAVMPDRPVKDKTGVYVAIALGLVALIGGALAFVALVLPGLSNRQMESVITPREATRNALARTTASGTPSPARTAGALRTPTRSAGLLRTPTGRVSPPAALPEGYELFESNIYPYTIGYPDDWEAQPAFEFEDITVDTFIGDGLTANIYADRDLRSLSVDALMRTVMQGNEDENPTDVRRLGEMRVDGQRALIYRWTDSEGASFIQAVWTSGTHGWLATLYVENGDTDAQLDFFREMLGTLRLRLR